MGEAPRRGRAPASRDSQAQLEQARTGLGGDSLTSARLDCEATPPHPVLSQLKFSVFLITMLWLTRKNKIFSSINLM